MSADNLIDETTVRKFLTLLHSRAASALSHERHPGVIQLVAIAPDDTGVTTSAFAVGDVDHMLEAALACTLTHNCYVEVRTVKPGRPSERGRGKIDATLGVFAFVIDHDADTGKAGRLRDDTVVIETSPGNCQEWLFLFRALCAAEAKPLGEQIRKSVGADHDTGVITQPFRLPGLLNHPGAKKIARGRTLVASKLIRVSDRLWTPTELEAEFAIDAPAVKPLPPAAPRKLNGRRTSTPAAVERRLSRKAAVGMDRSAQFQSAANAAIRAGLTPEQFEDMARQHPEGCAQKYLENGDRLKQEADRSFEKIEQEQASAEAAAEAEHVEQVAAGKAIDGAALLDSVYEFLSRFVVYPSKEARTAHVLWIAHTHLMDCWDTTPRLAFLSAEPASGKTRALEISELLVPAPVLAVNVSPAYLVRKIASEAGVTVLFDEVDTVFNSYRAKEGSEDVRGLLNGGYRRGAVVGRCYMSGSTAMTEELHSFAAVALAGLGTLPDTIRSRSVVIRMQRRAPDEHVTPYRRRHHATEGEALCGRLAAWATAIASKITVPDMPPEIVDRDADIWESLIAVADAAGGHWPDTVRVAAVTLVTLIRGEAEDQGRGVQLLAHVRTAFGEADSAATNIILDRLHKMDESPYLDIRGKALTDRQLAVRLRPYGIKPKPVRIGTQVLRGYARADFYDAWRRYLPAAPR